MLLSPREDGLFLVRESTNFPGDYTLCVCYQGKVEHYRVIFKDNRVTIDEEEFFENLTKLVEVGGVCEGITGWVRSGWLRKPPVIICDIPTRRDGRRA